MVDLTIISFLTKSLALTKVLLLQGTTVASNSFSYVQGDGIPAFFRQNIYDDDVSL
jgi:hypothetical protein